MENNNESIHEESQFEEDEHNQEDQIAQKVKELELSLPREKGFLSPHLYLYHGLWIPCDFLRGFLSYQTHFQPQETDILLVSKPKSGTTWLKSLAFTLVNRDIWSPNNSTHPLLSHSPHELVPWFEISTHSKANLPELSESCIDNGRLRPRLLATHLPYGSLPDSVKKSGTRIVYICRNILDTAVSFWHFSRRLRKGVADQATLEEYVDSVCKGVEDFGPHWVHVLGYWEESLKESPNNKVLFIKYEELKEDPVSGIKNLAEFMGFPFKLEEEEDGVPQQIVQLCSIQNLIELKVNKSGHTPQRDDSVFFRKGQVGDWTNHLSGSMAQRLQKVMEDKFQGSGLTFKTGL